MPRTNQTKQQIYLDQTFGKEDNLLKQIKSLTEEARVTHMQLSPHEGQLLSFFAQLIKADKIVEIGSLYSYSTLHLARALHSKKGLVFTFDTSKERHLKAQELIKNHPEFNHIRWITGKALETLPQIEKEGPFDMVFIDADKEAYVQYLDWAEKHLRPGGLLLADNSFLFGSVYEEPERKTSAKTTQIMKDLNERLATSPLWTSSLIPTKEGLTIAFKNNS